MFNYYVIKVSDWFEVRRAVGAGLNDARTVDAFYDEQDAYAYASYLQNRSDEQAE